MKLAEASSQDAWQPLTPPGVARFAGATFGRLVLVQVIFAALAGIAVITFLASAWFPTLSEAAKQLPEESYISRGQLVWTGPSPILLADSPWLAVMVDLHQNQTIRYPSDLQVEFSARSIRFISILGYMDLPYPTGWIIAFNQPELGSWWNAWKPFLAAGAGIVTAVGLLLLWAMLAALYAFPAGAVCRFVHHGITWSAVWKLCCAAQLPGSLLMAFTLLLYSLRAVDLVQWLFVAGTHLLISWIYICLATFFLPEELSRQRGRTNPFRG